MFVRLILAGLVQQLKEKNYPIVISEREAKSAAEEAEEAELLIHLQVSFYLSPFYCQDRLTSFQAIIRSQVQSISSFIDQTKNPEAP